VIGISKLYCGTVEPSDVLRYGGRSGSLPSRLLQFSKDKRPVVVWNATKRCNLHCLHCYSGSDNSASEEELDTREAEAMIDDLAEYGSPVLLFSGGEPLMRKDLFDLIGHARNRGMRAVLSTNGTLITRGIAERLEEYGLSYVGISVDGVPETHNRFRGRSDAYERALEGLEHCRNAGIKVGLRFTMSRYNVQDLSGVFDLVEERAIPRICVYHLVPAGRGSELADGCMPHEQTREALDLMINRTRLLHERGHAPEVLTVDNHADGVYLYLRLLRENPERAERVFELLRMNGGNSSGVGIGCVSWDGTVHPDQFWRHYRIGNVRERPFSELWEDRSDPLLDMLKDKRAHVKGRCADCSFLELCGGNFRVRAEALTGDTWASDPACYLRDDEIGLNEGA